MGEFLPESLAIKWILADQDLFDELVEDMRTNDFGRGEAVALGAIVCDDRQQRKVDLVSRPRMRMPSRVGVAIGRVRKDAHVNIDDLQVFSSRFFLCPAGGGIRQMSKVRSTVLSRHRLDCFGADVRGDAFAEGLRMLTCNTASLMS
jgi:hypothetical protein